MAPKQKKEVLPAEHEIADDEKKSESEVIEAPVKRGLVWFDLSEQQCQTLWAANGSNEQISLLCEYLNVNHYESNTRSAVMVDFCFYNIVFSHYEEGFSDDKTSALFSILKIVFDLATAPPQTPLMENFQRFKELVLQHSVEGGDSVVVFTEQDVRRITEFVTRSFYRYYKPYQMVFSLRQKPDHVSRDLVVETPLSAPPLQEFTQEGGELGDLPDEVGSRTGASDAAGGSEAAESRSQSRLGEGEDAPSRPDSKLKSGDPASSIVDDRSEVTPTPETAGGGGKQASGVAGAQRLQPEVAELVEAEVARRVETMRRAVEMKDDQLAERLAMMERRLASAGMEERL